MLQSVAAQDHAWTSAKLGFARPLFSQSRKQVIVWFVRPKAASDPRHPDSPEVHSSASRTCCPLWQDSHKPFFQQDNVRTNTARVSQDWFRHISTLSWPIRSSDLSRIEHIWDHFGWQQVGQPVSLVELEQRLQQLWNKMM
ncbi:hypothetical protein TNCV_5142241 [Trichonephila clavipes]|nr:hypothetical protein TNCV_5142241 [Trichonephila clavipes]